MGSSLMSGVEMLKSLSHKVQVHLASCGDGCSRRRSNRRPRQQNKRHAIAFHTLL